MKEEMKNDFVNDEDLDYIEEISQDSHSKHSHEDHSHSVASSMDSFKYQTGVWTPS